MEISGILTKQGHKMKTWRRRHFELHENCLYYYMYDGGPLKGEFIIDENTTVQISNLRRHGFSLVKKNGTTLNMFADNAIDKDRWMKSFLKVIHRIKSSHAEVEESNNVSMRRQDMNATGDTYSISVHIIQAKDLAPKGSTDTYAKVHVDAQTAVTKVIKKELNPVWDEHFSFAWTSDLRFVRIEVWNDDPMHSSRDNFLGVIYVPILSLHPNSVSSLWYKLGKRSSRSNVRGEIKVSVSCNRPPDPYILKVLEDVQKIPELQTKAVDIIRNFEIDSTMDQKQDFESFDGSDLFPSCLPPIESESIEDLSLRVTLKPTLDKSTSASAEGLLILTNYRLVFVSHSRIAFGDDWTSTTSHSALSEELTCSIPLTMVVNLNIQAYYDGSSSQIEDALSIVTNDSRVCLVVFLLLIIFLGICFYLSWVSFANNL